MMKSIRSGLGARVGVAALGVGILTVVGSGVASADETIDVSVTIAPDASAGALALTVAGNATALTEGEPTETDRIFTGTLPTVTVTDTRPAGTITDPTVEWYVLGSITDFIGTAGQPNIVSADSFGWEPALLAGDDEVVDAGIPVEPGEGFRSDAPELLYYTDTPDGESGPGVWTANAELTLQTPSSVAPGSYAATMTLSLFEGGED